MFLFLLKNLARKGLIHLNRDGAISWAIFGLENGLSIIYFQAIILTVVIYHA